MTYASASHVPDSNAPHPLFSCSNTCERSDLATNFMTALPDWLGTLVHLGYVDMSNNTLTALPPSMKDVNQIWWLYVASVRRCRLTAEVVVDLASSWVAMHGVVVCGVPRHACRVAIPPGSHDTHSSSLCCSIAIALRYQASPLPHFHTLSHTRTRAHSPIDDFLIDIHMSP